MILNEVTLSVSYFPPCPSFALSVTFAPRVGRQCALLQLLHIVNWQQRDGELFFMTFQVFVCFSAIVQCLIFRVFAVLPAANGYSVPIIPPAKEIRDKRLLQSLN